MDVEFKDAFLVVVVASVDFFLGGVTLTDLQVLNYHCIPGINPMQ